jgi:hypothetical protein
MNSLDREAIQEEIRTLAHQCKCYSYNGPCRACAKAEKLDAKLARLEAEDELLGQVSRWLFTNGHQDAAIALSSAILRGDLRKPEKT